MNRPRPKRKQVVTIITPVARVAVDNACSKWQWQALRKAYCDAAGDDGDTQTWISRVFDINQIRKTGFS
ncbi:MAG: hypothetical protein WA474_11765 [Candidatus Sulfotelmatobacter sp.]